MTLTSSRLQTVRPSATVAMTDRALQLRAQGRHIISFTAGEPDFDTPAHIVDAAAQAMRRGQTRYTPVVGLAALREAVAATSTEVRRVPVTADNVIISTGAKQVLYNFFMALLNPGDEVLIPAPYWVSYPDQVRLAGGTPIIVTTSPDRVWVPHTDDLDRDLAPPPRVLVLNSPANPTGAVYPRDALADIAQWASRHNLWVVSDEIYRELVYGDAAFHSPLTLAPPHHRHRILVVDGLSKSHAMTGFRLGFGIAHPDLIAAMSVIQGQSTSCATSISQAAALAALQGPNDFLPDWRNAYTRRRDQLISGLRQLPGVRCTLPAGAFYALPNISAAAARLGADATDIDLAEHLLETAGVATVPGTPFGAPGHLRFSYAVSEDTIAQGLARMADVLP